MRGADRVLQAGVETGRRQKPVLEPALDEARHHDADDEDRDGGDDRREGDGDRTDL